MKRVRTFLCRVLGHAAPVRHDYDLSVGKLLIDRCGRCSTLLGTSTSPPIPYPRRRIA